MPAALEFATLVAAAPRADRKLRVYSMIMDETREFDLDAPAPSGRHDWSDYVFGVAAMLEKSGRRLAGADLVVSSDVPLGAGLSSSAALEVSVAHALLPPLGPAVRAGRGGESLPAGGERLRRHALRHHGPVCLGLRRRRQRAADRLPLARLAPVPIAPNLRLVIANSNVRHQHAGGEYNARREACEEGVRLLRPVSGRSRRCATSRRPISSAIAASCPTSSIAAAAISSPRTPACSRPSGR